MHILKFLALAFVGSACALPVVTLPWFGQVSLDSLVEYLGYTSDSTEDKTIYDILKENKQYTRLVKAIDLSENMVGFLSDPSKKITFFAVPNSNLPHHRHHHGHHGHNESLVTFLADGLSDVDRDLGGLVQRAEELEKEPGSPDKEKRKEALVRIISKIIAYHILPGAYEATDLVRNSTYATNLTLDDGSMDSQPLRLNVFGTLVPPRLRINVVIEVTKSDIKAKNGVIHQISHPLLPPPSIFQETFLIPEVFSFFTSAIQRAGLTGAIDKRKCSKGGDNSGLMGATAITAFVPTSGAFRRLPHKLRRYLFSPFGHKALKKLLEYHIVPNSVLYTDYFHNSTSHGTKFGRTPCFEDGLEMQSASSATALLGDDENLVFRGHHHGPLFELVYDYNVTLPTLLKDHFLQVHVARYKSTLPVPRLPQYFTKFKVNDRHVGPFDIPARNGALHVLTSILDPRKGHEYHWHGDTGNDEAAWADWEEWFPQWAMEN